MNSLMNSLQLTQLFDESTLTPTELASLVTKPNKDSSTYILKTPCGSFRFPGVYELTADELETRSNYSMYDNYRSFYILDENTETYRLLSEYVRRCRFFKNVDVNALFEGSFAEGWTFKDYEKVKCLCDAYDYQETERQETLTKKREEREELERQRKENGETPTASSAAPSPSLSAQTTDALLKTAMDVLGSAFAPPPSSTVSSTTTTTTQSTPPLTYSYSTNVDNAMVDNLMNSFMKGFTSGDTTSPTNSNSNTSKAIADLIKIFSPPATTTTTSTDDSTRVNKVL